MSLLPYPRLGQPSELLLIQIILSQEKNIQQLNELIESLQRQLLHCRGSNNTTIHTTTSPASEVSEVEGQEIIDD